MKLTYSPASTAEVKGRWGYRSAVPIGPRGAGWASSTFTCTFILFVSTPLFVSHDTRQHAAKDHDSRIYRFPQNF